MSESAQQRGHVMAIMLDGKWRTLFELDDALRAQGHIYLTTSISARLREMRNSEYGGWTLRAASVQEKAQRFTSTAFFLQSHQSSKAYKKGYSREGIRGIHRNKADHH